MFPNSRAMYEISRAAIARQCGRFAATRLFLRFGRRQDGAAAVEFGFILLPFISILLMTMETAAYFFAQQTLETVVVDSGRLIMTGQAKGYSADNFKTAVCSKVVAWW